MTPQEEHLPPFLAWQPEHHLQKKAKIITGTPKQSKIYNWNKSNVEFFQQIYFALIEAIPASLIFAVNPSPNSIVGFRTKS